MKNWFKLPYLIFFVAFGFLISSAYAKSPWPLHIIDNSLSGADGVHLFDIDGDGFQDAVVGWEESGKVIFYKNPGFQKVKKNWPKTDVSGGLNVMKIEDARFADFSGDGQIDAIVSATEMHSMKLGIHWLTDFTRFTDSRSWTGTWIVPSVKHLFLKVDIGQIDGIGGQDIVVGTKGKNGYQGKLLWYQAPDQANVNTAQQWKAFEIDDIHWIKNIKILDIDGDGDNDILMSDGKSFALYENLGFQDQDEIQWKKHLLPPTGYFTVCDMGDDFDGLSIVASVGTSAKDNTHTVAKLIQLRFEDGIQMDRVTDIVLDRPMPKDKPQFVTKGIACGDLNNDRLVDLVFSISGHGVGVFAALAQSKDVSQPWKLVEISSRKYNHFSKGIKHDNIELVDIDGDGDLDIITTEENGGTFMPKGMGLVWFENLLYK